jgi:hypothetical protein
MNIPVEEKKIEAVKRMKMLDIFPQTIRQFEKDGYISISEPPHGAFFWADEEQQKIINKIQEEYNLLVYMGIMAYTEFGKMVSFLYVSDHREEWDDDNLNLLNDEAMTYTVNYDAPDCSEFGYIMFKRSVAAGLIRTA